MFAIFMFDDIWIESKVQPHFKDFKPRGVIKDGLQGVSINEPKLIHVVELFRPNDKYHNPKCRNISSAF